jgi:molybdopterin converting factor subunit 1
MIRVLLFAGLAEIAGASAINLELLEEKTSVQWVRAKLAEMYPQMTDLLEKSMAALNQEYAENDAQITAADEIAFIPPVSGG